MAIEATKPAPFITGPVLREIYKELGPIRAELLAGLMCSILPKYGLDTRNRFHEWVATCGVESGEMTLREENMNYKAERLQVVFKKYFPTKAKAVQYARQPIAIANLVYAKRMGNRDVASGDGWRYRGGGFIQLTGADMYASYGKYIGKTKDEAAELVRTQDYWAMDSAAWLFSIEKKLNDEADANLLRSIREQVNGGQNGYKEFVDYFHLALKAMPV